MLDNDHVDYLYEILPPKIIRPLNQLMSNPIKEIDDLCQKVESKTLSTLLRDIINALVRNRIDEAKTFIGKHQKKLFQ